MRIQVMSDLHTEYAEFKYTEPAGGIDALVLAGDIGIGTRGLDWITREVPEKIPVVYVLGNHEFWGQEYHSFIEEMRRLCRASGREIFSLEREAVTIGGVTFLGATMWTDFELLGTPEESMNYAAEEFTDFNVIEFDKAQFTPRHAQFLHRETVEWLTREFQTISEERRVVVTHHPPVTEALDGTIPFNSLTPCFASQRPDLVSHSRATLWICGHTHVFTDHRIGDTRVVSNPAGYPPFSVVNGFKNDLVYDV